MKKTKAMLIRFIMTALLVAGVTGCGSAEEDKAHKTEKTDLSGYLFETNGTKLAIDIPAEEVLDKLPKPQEKFEAPSCAFEGVDRTYAYGSFQVTTYEEDDVERIGTISLKDDTVETPEGLSLSETKADMEACYGTDYEDKSGMYVYHKDDMKLKILIKDDKIISIEYANTKI